LVTIAVVLNHRDALPTRSGLSFCCVSGAELLRDILHGSGVRGARALLRSRKFDLGLVQCRTMADTSSQTAHELDMVLTKPQGLVDGMLIRST
jgi:hypothetical protein